MKHFIQNQKNHQEEENVNTGIDRQGNTKVRRLMFMVAMNAIGLDKDLKVIELH